MERERERVALTVTVNRCEDNVVEAPLVNGNGRVDGLIWVHGWWCVARLDGAEAACTCARVSHQLFAHARARVCVSGAGVGLGKRV